MRREGFELSIGRPKVLMRKDENTGETLEPIEELFIDLDEEFTGVVMEKIIQRKGELVDMRPSGTGKTRLKFLIPTRGLIGYHGEFLTDTSGSGIMNRSFHSYGHFRGAIESRKRGVLISTDSGTANAYALFFLQERGMLFIGPGDPVYCGMIVGEHTRDNDLEVNPTKSKQLSNMRAAGKDDAIKLSTHLSMTIEQAITYIAEDERVEITPTSIRLRKRFLDPNERKRMSRVSKEI
jgi:GTP-binding protein